MILTKFLLMPFTPHFKSVKDRMTCLTWLYNVWFVGAFQSIFGLCYSVCRGIYLAAVFYHKDSLLVTAEDQIPIVEVDDSYSSSLMQDFLWFTKVCLLVLTSSCFLLQQVPTHLSCVSSAVLHVGGRAMAQTEHVRVHVFFIHTAGPT